MSGTSKPRQEPALTPCPLCAGPMTVNLEVYISEAGATNMPASWWARLRHFCQECRFTVRESWHKPDWRVATARAEIADLTGAIELLTAAFSERHPPNVKRTQKSVPRLTLAEAEAQRRAKHGK